MELLHECHQFFFFSNATDDTLMNDSSGNELIVTFKGFDFLDNELEESEV